jgi:hypothetical protein
MSTCTVFYDDEEWTVDYDYSPGRPGVHTLRNGDPGYPDEPAELYVNTVSCGFWKLDFNELSEEKQAYIEQQIIDKICADNASADAAEYEYWCSQKGIDP